MKTLLKIITPVLIVAAVSAAGTASAATNLVVRLVAVSASVSQPDPELVDVENILKRNLPFASYKLLATEKMKFPANSTFGMRRFKIRCAGSQDNLQIAVERQKKQLISTIVSLSDDTPVIMGGFTMRRENAKAVFVFTTSD